ncbi:MAG: VWA domain-containing protein [Prevotellaceae bacterium]|jgi:Ca-activated chloride channel family protein|nr:VWA domain-containing protein [Prevotellaceae bacterium]
MIEFIRNLEYKNPYFAWLLMFIPLLLLIYGLSIYLRNRNLSRFGDIKLIGRLMPLASKYRGWVKISTVCTAILFFTFALMQPRLGQVIAEVKSKGAEVIIALDVSNSMLATDFSPSRLERSKLAIARLVEALKEDRIGLIVFAGDAYVQLPVTTDYMSAKSFLNAINTGIVSRQGTDMSKAIALAMKSFSSQSENSRAMIIITDGENQEGNPVEMAEIAHRDGITVHTVGIGSTDGAPIIFADGSMLKDKSGEIVMSRLDQNTLKLVASAGGGTATVASQSDLGLNSIIQNIKDMEKKELLSTEFRSYYEYFHIPLTLALLLLVLDVFILERKNRILQNFSIFKTQF